MDIQHASMYILHYNVTHYATARLRAESHPNYENYFLIKWTWNAEWNTLYIASHRFRFENYYIKNKD